MPTQINLKYLQELRTRLDREGSGAMVGNPWVIADCCMTAKDKRAPAQFRANLDAAIEVAKKDPDRVFGVIPDK